MGSFLKYVLYAFIIVAIYFVIAGFYEGKLDKNSTIGEMADHVTSNTENAIKDGYQSTKDAVQRGVEEITIETQEAVEQP
ncbi:MAG: hypothetical protein J5895_02885 [Alphaproteobacteria bacterium]|nr:hypothetical protein [Alphaproteobacteria bacterium]